jgi:hypothetical protein
VRCYFLRSGYVVDVRILPPGLTDQDSLARARTLFPPRRGPIDFLEVWDGDRLILRETFVPFLSQTTDAGTRQVPSPPAVFRKGPGERYSDVIIRC